MSVRILTSIEIKEGIETMTDKSKTIYSCTIWILLACFIPANANICYVKNSNTGQFPVKNKNETKTYNSKSLPSQSFLDAYVQVVVANDQDEGLNTIGKSSSKKYRRKDPYLALGLAFFPGFFIHGLGHFYIGENKTGTLLLLSEVFAVGEFYLGIWFAVATMDDPDPPKGVDLLFITSIIIFLSGWIYDVAQAPFKAQRMNQEYENSISIYPSIKDKRITLNLALTLE